MKKQITLSSIEEVLLNEFNTDKGEFQKKLNQFDDIDWARLVLVVSVNFRVNISDSSADLLIKNIHSNTNKFAKLIKETILSAELLTDLEKQLHLDSLNQIRSLDTKITKDTLDIGLFRVGKSKLN